jgi:hypothetical protein
VTTNKGSAKPLYVGSIPTRASSLSLHLAVAIGFVVALSFALICVRFAKNRAKLCSDLAQIWATIYLTHKVWAGGPK